MEMGKAKMGPEGTMLLPQVGRLYGAELLHEITTGNSGDKIYEAAEAAPRRSILRVCEYSEKKRAHRDFETRWTEYLAARMEGIAKPVRSVNNRLYEILQAGGKRYILSLQEKAPGKTVDPGDPAEWNEGLFFRLGMLMGRMHRLTMEYEGNVPCPAFKWNGPHFWRGGIAILDEGVRQGEKRLLKELERLPVDKAGYGIVHYDIHTDNFLVANDAITLIDFDACQFNWYAADLASALFFMVRKGAGPHETEKARTAFAEACLLSCLKGYLETHSISAYWIGNLDLFMRYQMVDEYVAAQISGEEDGFGPWYLDWHKARIQNNLPYVRIDYEKIRRSILP